MKWGKIIIVPILTKSVCLCGGRIHSLYDFNDCKVNIISTVLQDSCNWYTYVTWWGNEYELPEDEHDSVETCRGVTIYEN